MEKESDYFQKETILNKHLLYELSKVTSVPGIDIMGTKKLPSRRGYGGFYTKPAQEMAMLKSFSRPRTAKTVDTTATQQNRQTDGSTQALKESHKSLEQ